MWQRTLAFVFVLGLFVDTLPALRADDLSDKFVGVWKTKEKFAGYDLRITIGNDGGQWSIKGTFEKGGAGAGAFIGEKVRFAERSLTYWLRMIKKPEGTWLDHDTTLRLDGDALVMSWVAKNGKEIVRACERVSEPKQIAKAPAKEPAKPKLVAKLEEKLVGTWKGSTGRFDEYWTVTHDGTKFTITGTYWKNGKEVGSCHGAEVSVGQDHVTFRRVFDKKPESRLGNNTTYSLKATDAGVELFVGSVAKGKSEILKAAEEPKAVAARERPRPPAPARKNDGHYLGIWTGTFPGTSDRLNLNVFTEKNGLTIEGFVMSGENKRLAYFREVGVKMDAEGTSLTLTPTWLEKAAPITGTPTVTLTPQPPGLRAVLADAKTTDPVTVELRAGNPKQFAKLMPAFDPKGKPVLPPGGKSSAFETFKLPPNIPPAKPFAVLEAKQRVVAVAVSPDGKRVALGSQHTLTGFTADLAVWDIEQQKQVWINKKMVVGEGFASVSKLAFSCDGKILAAQPYKAFDPLLRFFDSETGKELNSPPPLKMRVDCLAFHPSKLLLAVGTVKGGSHGQLELIDVSSGKSLWAIPHVHATAIDGLAFCPNGEMIATVGRTADDKGYCVKLFDAAKGTLIHDFGATQKGIGDSVTFSKDGKLVAGFFSDLNKPGIVIWDVASKSEIRRITDLAPGGHGTSRKLAFLADNKTLAAACTDHHLHLFDVTTGQRVGVYPRAYGSLVRDVFAVADGQLLLTSNESAGIPLWKQSDAQPPTTR